MKKDVNPFLHNAENGQTYLKNTSFSSILNHFSRLRMKGLNYNF